MAAIRNGAKFTRFFKSDYFNKVRHYIRKQPDMFQQLQVLTATKEYDAVAGLKWILQTPTKLNALEDSAKIGDPLRGGGIGYVAVLASRESTTDYKLLMT